MSARISGWCGGVDGAFDGFHETCTDRIARGLIERCDCPEHANDPQEDAA